MGRSARLEAERSGRVQDDAGKGALPRPPRDDRGRGLLGAGGGDRCHLVADRLRVLKMGGARGMEMRTIERIGCSSSEDLYRTRRAIAAGHLSKLYTPLSFLVSLVRVGLKRPPRRSHFSAQRSSA